MLWLDDHLSAAEKGLSSHLRSLIAARSVEGQVYAADDPIFSSATDSNEREQEISSSFVTPTSSRPFRFAKLTETFNEAGVCKEEQVQKAGSIQLRIFRIENVQDGQISSAEIIKIDDIVVHEDQKLTRSHQSR
jgi:hypothetical protein